MNNIDQSFFNSPPFIGDSTDPTLTLLPDSSKPKQTRLPYLIVQYPVVQNMKTIVLSFALMPMNLSTHDIHTWDTDQTFPAVVFSGGSDDLCLVFRAAQDRAAFLQRVKVGVQFELRLDVDCLESFLIRRPFTGIKATETYHVKGRVQKVMSRQLSSHAFTILDSTWNITPHVVPYVQCVRRVTLQEKLLAVLTEDGEEESFVYVFTAQTPDDRYDMLGMLHARKCINISLQKEISQILRYGRNAYSRIVLRTGNPAGNPQKPEIIIKLDGGKLKHARTVVNCLDRPSFWQALTTLMREEQDLPPMVAE